MGRKLVMKSVKNFSIYSFFLVPIVAMLYLDNQNAFAKVRTCTAVNTKSSVYARPKDTVSTTADPTRKECTFSVNSAPITSELYLDVDEESINWYEASWSGDEVEPDGFLNYFPFMLTSSVGENRIEIIKAIKNEIENSNDLKENLRNCVNAFYNRRGDFNFNPALSSLSMSWMISTDDPNELNITLNINNKTIILTTWRRSQ